MLTEVWINTSLRKLAREPILESRVWWTREIQVGWGWWGKPYPGRCHVSRDINEREGQPGKGLGRQHSRQREWPGQRPWIGKELGRFKGWKKASDAAVWEYRYRIGQTGLSSCHPTPVHTAKRRSRSVHCTSPPSVRSPFFVFHHLHSHHHLIPASRPGFANGLPLPWVAPLPTISHNAECRIVLIYPPA